ncbi:MULTISPECIES: DUF1304 domain-containing protein [Rhodomicrobium]|uniref:DUF1304 domain-containing protein n=1 Tax=Rhodomicrobium TaxID=1068 RepID=UPI000B4A9AEA|nr:MULTISPECIES: DUF1304 domain-containing protein [Rhodomicrobium]
MDIAAVILTGIVLAIHVYIVLIETVLFRTRGAKVLGIPPTRVEEMAPAMSNQGCYNLFLVAALVLGFVYPDPKVAEAFTLFGLACVIVAGIWGALTVKPRILFVQTVPAALALGAVVLS